MLKREWGAESNGKLLHLFIPSKTATLVPEFAVKDLPWTEHSDDKDDEFQNVKDLDISLLDVEIWFHFHLQ